MYRHIKLLSTLCNEIQQKMMMIPLLATAILANAASLATLTHIQFVSKNWIITCILMTAYVDSTLMVLFTLGGMVTINRRSKAFIETLESYHIRGLGDTDWKWISTFRRSCQRLKIKFGDNNFIEKLTPLKCLHCAARLTLQILLCERRYL